MIEYVQRLCQAVTGSRCQAPRLSNWSFVKPSQSNIGVDVLDIATAGVAAAIPANAKLYGSHFSTGLAYSGKGGGMSAFVQGWGAGGGAGIGWSPTIGAKRIGMMSNGIKKSVTDSFAGATTGKLLDWLKGAAPGGVSGGSRLIAGPDAMGDCSLNDFQNAYATICSLGMNFVVNGVSCGIVFISKQRPVILGDDIVYVKAFGLMAGAGLATSLDVEASGMIYKLNVN